MSLHILLKEVVVSNNKYQRLLDKNAPTEKKILTTIGIRAMKSWKQIKKFLKKNYDFQSELLFYGRKYGWCYRYRRKKKTLCVLFPETKAFTVLVTLGKKEIELFEQSLSTFNKNTQPSVVNSLDNLRPLWATTREIDGVVYEGNLNRKMSYNNMLSPVIISQLFKSLIEYYN